VAWDFPDNDMPRKLVIPVTLDEMPVYYDEGDHPAGLRFRTRDGNLVEVRLEMDEYEKLLERQNKVIGIMRDDSLK
jgi:hypothetical protein